VRESKVWHEAEFLDKIQKKVFRVFLLAAHKSALQLCLEISISSNSRILVQFLEFNYCTKEENLIENPPSLRFKKSIQEPEVWELSRLCLENLTKLDVHEFVFWIVRAGTYWKRTDWGRDMMGTVWKSQIYWGQCEQEQFVRRQFEQELAEEVLQWKKETIDRDMLK
jgi:hypothetical protein